VAARLTPRGLEVVAQGQSANRLALGLGLGIGAVGTAYVIWRAHRSS
jgi:hypothetical protein